MCVSVRELPSKAAPVTVSGKRVPEVTIMDKVTIFFFSDTTLNILGYAVAQLLEALLY